MVRSIILALLTLAATTALASPPQKDLQSKADQVRAAMDARDFDFAERLVRDLGRVDPAAFKANNYAYLLARLVERQGHISEATGLYLALLDSGSVLGEYALWHLASCARAAADLTLERRYLTRLVASYSSSALVAGARSRLIDNLFESADYRAAIALLRPVASASLASARGHASGRGAMARLGQAYMKLGDRAGAREVFAELVAGSRDDYALEAALGLDGLDRATGASPSEFEALRRARIYLENRHWAEARAHLLDIVQRFPDSPNRAEASYQTGFTYYREDKYEDAVTWFERAHSEFPTRKEGEQGYYWVANSLQKARRYEEAARRYTDFIAAYPESDLVDRAYRNVVDCLRYAGDDSGAMAWSNRLEATFAGKPLAAVGLFDKAKIELVRGNFETAAGLLVRLQARTISPKLVGAPARGEAEFMRAYAIEQMGRLPEAAALYLVIPDERDNYFGQRATQRLRAFASSEKGRLATDPLLRRYRDQAHAALAPGRYQEAKDAATRALRLTVGSETQRDLLQVLKVCYANLSPYSSVYRYRLVPAARAVVETASNGADAGRNPPRHDALAAELIFLGLYDEGTTELRLGGFSIARPDGDPTYSMAVYSNRGDHSHFAISFAEPVFRGVPQDFRLELLPRDLAEMLYPAPYRDALNRHASALHVDPRIVLSLARQESRFNPSAKSPASARGLLQLIPETALKLAAEEGIKPFELDDVYNPETAVRMAVRYVSDLLALFPNNPYAVAASYDSGEQSVERWIFRARSSDVDRFVLEIPVPETKDYVGKVMNNYWAYQQLYSEDLKARRE
jgi:soluble lytic murein transglycosylase